MLHEICERLGVQKSAVNRALYPRVREYEKVYNRERYRTQVCTKCGAPESEEDVRQALTDIAHLVRYEWRLRDHDIGLVLRTIEQVLNQYGIEVPS